MKFIIRDEKTNDEVLTALVFQAVGAASMCWSKIEQAGTFKSTEAADVAHALLFEMGKRGLLK